MNIHALYRAPSLLISLSLPIMVSVYLYISQSLVSACMYVCMSCVCVSVHTFMVWSPGEGRLEVQRDSSATDSLMSANTHTSHSSACTALTLTHAQTHTDTRTTTKCEFARQHDLRSFFHRRAGREIRALGCVVIPIHSDHMMSTLQP